MHKIQRIYFKFKSYLYNEYRSNQILFNLFIVRIQDKFIGWNRRRKSTKHPKEIEETRN